MTCPSCASQRITSDMRQIPDTVLAPDKLPQLAVTLRGYICLTPRCGQSIGFRL